jgi:hypothetical protein
VEFAEAVRSKTIPFQATVKELKGGLADGS